MSSSELGAAAGEPRYMALARQLADDIRGGKYPVGSLLPTEADLTSRFAISRFTVREAIRQLQTQGLVVRRQGVGTRVIAEAPVHHYVHARRSVEELLQYGTQSLLQAMDMTEVTADASMAELIGCAEGERFLKVTGLRMPVDEPDGPPVCWTEIYILSAYAGIRDEIGHGNVVIANLIESRYGHRATEIRQDMTAVTLPREIAGLLGLRPGSPGLLVHRWYTGPDGKDFEITISMHPGHSFSYSMRLTRNANPQSSPV